MCSASFQSSAALQWHCPGEGLLWRVLVEGLRKKKEYERMHSKETGLARLRNVIEEAYQSLQTSFY